MVDRGCYGRLASLRRDTGAEPVRLTNMDEQIAEPVATYGAESDAEQASNSDEPTRQSVPRGPSGHFLPGLAPKSPGRPRKGESVLEQTHKVVESKAKRAAQAKLKRMFRDDAVGNRAWADYRDTFYGVPKQTLVVQQGDDPLAALLPSLLNDPDTVEGEYTVN